MLPMEITDDSSVEACIKEVVRKEGRIDVVVNCVNHMIIGSVEEETADEVLALYDTNVLGVLRVCQQLIPIMRRQGGGTIVNMSSLGGLLAVPYMSAYTSAKFALEALSEALYHEMKRYDIASSRAGKVLQWAQHLEVLEVRHFLVQQDLQQSSQKSPQELQ